MPKNLVTTASFRSLVSAAYLAAVMVKYEHWAVQSGAAHSPTSIELVTIVPQTAYPLAAIHRMYPENDTAIVHR